MPACTDISAGSTLLIVHSCRLLRFISCIYLYLVSFLLNLYYYITLTYFLQAFKSRIISRPRNIASDKKIFIACPFCGSFCINICVSVNLVSILSFFVLIDSTHDLIYLVIVIV